MGAASPSRDRFGEGAAITLPEFGVAEFVESAAEKGQAISGHHNDNFVFRLTDELAAALGRGAGTAVTVRRPREGALPVVIRTWRDEAAILRALRGALPHVPECLVRTGDYAIHSYVEGVPLSSICPNGKPVDTLLMRALAELLAQMTRVRRAALPPLPPGWPGDETDSQGFLRTLAHLAERQIRQPNWTAFGGLFAALGIPEDALRGLAGRVPAMTRRPYSLLHADLHRDNLIVSYDGHPPLICVDWELATYGDPLHDLATHLIRMRYPSYQWNEVIEAWAEAMRRTRPAAVNGLAKDLRHYLDFERAQSVFPDVMRAARSLEAAHDQKDLDEATASVRRALEAAEGPLGLRALPRPAEIERILFRWLRSRPGGRGGLAAGIRWVPDKRLAERPDFPHSAVRAALHAEGAAPAGRVFKGTAHLNSVVRVEGIGFPVVVRREVAKACRREPSFLSEHAVLRAIEDSGARVAAPRVLALGESYDGEMFSIHTYVGSADIDCPPDHPVEGLRPAEADSLVDQLCALTSVDHGRLDPVGGGGSFYRWLSDQLVLLVKGLPKESQKLAWFLGLPDARLLGRILRRYDVTRRTPALLHGDLNPWNLVRRDDGQGLTIIDWEMALVGDPLYDLVRHMHLTPTRPEIQARMFRRWERGLPPEHTRDWMRDRKVYRWVETVRSAYVDLDRLVTGAGLDAPNVRRAVDSYAMTLAAATAVLGQRSRPQWNPFLTRALA